MIRCYVWCLGFSVSFFLVGCKSSTLQVSPTSTLDDRSAQYAMRKVQLAGEERKAGTGHGQSMAPFYGEGTYLVIHPIAYNELQKGMLVAYKSASGERIVHELIRQEEGYWVAKGWSNAQEDPEWVTPDNLIGVVYATFQAEG